VPDDALVFTVDCPNHGARVLLGPRRVRTLTNLEDGDVELVWRCYCGATGRLRTGRIGETVAVEPADSASAA
jgi:hypothetical protein